MRAIWKGTISFGLVTIPIALYPATRREEEIKLHLLRAGDLSPINYKRVAEADGKEVPWNEIVKGYEYEEGRFVVLNDEDFNKVEVEGTKTVDITDFVPLAEVDPMFFSKPYYMEPGKGGEKAYSLLRDALSDSGKIGIAKVVIRTREYLAAVKPEKQGLVLELMHFAGQLADASEIKVPKVKEISKKELEMAKALIEGMSGPWEPDKYHDEYRDALRKLIDEKIAHGGELPEKPKVTPKPGKVVDLVAVLQQSLAQTQAKKGAAKKTPAKPAKGKKKAA